MNYSFERERCRNCSRRAECIGKSTRIARLLTVSVNTPKLYEYSQRAKTPEFLEEYRKRAKIEPKNAELKRFHGLDRAKGYGLQSVRIQAKLTVLAVNLKRIAKMVSGSKGFNAIVLKFSDRLLLINLQYFPEAGAEAA
mgnify:CR=1 FL=1